MAHMVFKIFIFLILRNDLKNTCLTFSDGNVEMFSIKEGINKVDSLGNIQGLQTLLFHQKLISLQNSITSTKKCMFNMNKSRCDVSMMLKSTKSYYKFCF